MKKHCKRFLSVFLAVFAIFQLCSVNVSAASASPKLSKTKLTLYVGKKTTLKMKNIGKKKAKWTTSNKKVATVNSKGVVVAKKKGTAKITAKVGKKKYVCTVTVKKKSSPPKPTPEEVQYVSYISNRSIQYESNDECYRFFFSLLDQNEKPMASTATVKMRIVNGQQTVYSGEKKVTKADFSNWGNDIKGYKLTCCVVIPFEEIQAGPSTTGTFYYQVSVLVNTRSP